MVMRFIILRCDFRSVREIECLGLQLFRELSPRMGSHPLLRYLYFHLATYNLCISLSLLPRVPTLYGCG